MTHVQRIIRDLREVHETLEDRYDLKDHAKDQALLEAAKLLEKYERRILYDELYEASVACQK